MYSTYGYPPPYQPLYYPMQAPPPGPPVDPYQSLEMADKWWHDVRKKIADDIEKKNSKKGWALPKISFWQMLLIMVAFGPWVGFATKWAWVAMLRAY